MAEASLQVTTLLVELAHLLIVLRVRTVYSGVRRTHSFAPHDEDGQESQYVVQRHRTAHQR